MWINHGSRHGRVITWLKLGINLGYKSWLPGKSNASVVDFCIALLKAG